MSPHCCEEKVGLKGEYILFRLVFVCAILCDGYLLFSFLVAEVLEGNLVAKYFYSRQIYHCRENIQERLELSHVNLKKLSLLREWFHYERRFSQLLIYYGRVMF